MHALELSLTLTRPAFKLAVDLRLPARGVTVLFGPSGSGKTTLLRCVAGLERATGRIAIGDTLWQDDKRAHFTPTWQRAVGFVFQEASLFEHMNVQANLNYGIKRDGQTGGQAALQAAIELLGIGPLLKRTTDNLSGGERQRVAIARALAMQPRILLLDEPLASLDQAKRQDILPWLERLHRELRIPVLYVTHAMDELARLGDHVVLLEDGRVQAHGSVAQVLSNADIATSLGALAGAMLAGVVCEDNARFHLTRIDVGNASLWLRSQNLHLGSAVRLHIHANDVSLSLAEPINSSIQNCIPGTITGITSDTHPAHAIVTIGHGEQRLLSRVTQRAVAALHLQVGSPVWCQIKAVALAGR
ncbi:MAG: molybdenum ABC transporter ATP-binding protein [Burkholderiales bacterium]